jgi:putative endonuclease
MIAFVTSERAASSRNEIGAAGELAVRDQVTAQGWTVIASNVRWREGELDLIALDGGVLVFAEVKTLLARGAGGAAGFSPFESIDRRKQQQVRSLACRWLAHDLELVKMAAGRRIGGLRFDAFAVTLAPDLSLIRIEHVEDAF